MNENEVSIIDRKSAILLIMLGSSELLLKDIEKDLHKMHANMRQRPKMIIGQLLQKAHGMHALYDQLSELAVQASTPEEGYNVVDAYMCDINTCLREIMMMWNAMHGKDSNEKQIKLESVLKLMATSPVVPQEDIDRITNFK